MELFDSLQVSKMCLIELAANQCYILVCENCTLCASNPISEFKEFTVLLVQVQVQVQVQRYNFWLVAP
jgi:hypothetical protein